MHEKGFLCPIVSWISEKITRPPSHSLSIHHHHRKSFILYFAIIKQILSLLLVVSICSFIYEKASANVVDVRRVCFCRERMIWWRNENSRNMKRRMNWKKEYYSRKCSLICRLNRYLLFRAYSFIHNANQSVSVECFLQQVLVLIRQRIDIDRSKICFLSQQNNVNKWIVSIEYRITIVCMSGHHPGLIDSRLTSTFSLFLFADRNQANQANDYDRSIITNSMINRPHGVFVSINIILEWILYLCWERESCSRPYSFWMLWNGSCCGQCISGAYYIISKARWDRLTCL